MNSYCRFRLLLGLLAVAPLFGQPDQDPAAVPTRALSPVYPYAFLVEGRGGWAEVRFSVDYTGRATFCTPVAASHPAFGKALQAEIESMEFTAPRKDGKPIMATSQERYDFPAEPPLDAVAREVLAELRKPHPEFVKLDQLDQPPSAIKQEPPTYPWALRGEDVTGSAEIEFVIDRNGRVLFPRIVSATRSEFGWAAATAVSRWRFRPPQKEGRRVDVRMTVPVAFNRSGDSW